MNLEIKQFFKRYFLITYTFLKSLYDAFTFLHNKENQFFRDKICWAINKAIFSHFQTFERTFPLLENRQKQQLKNKNNFCAIDINYSSLPHRYPNKQI